MASRPAYGWKVDRAALTSAAGAFAADAQRSVYLHDNDLEDVPLELADFLTFFEERRKRMRERLTTVLGVA